MKIWKVIVHNPTFITNVTALTMNFQPVAWVFSTSGSSNVHIFNNKIVAVSDSDVSNLIITKLTRMFIMLIKVVPFQHVRKIIRIALY